jgi:hypothetical protein
MRSISGLLKRLEQLDKTIKLRRPRYITVEVDDGDTE